MLERVKCSKCGKSIIPKQRVVLKRKGPGRGQLLSGGAGLFLVAIGLMLIVLYRQSPAGFIGFSGAFLGILAVVVLMSLYLRRRKIKEYINICPICGNKLGKVSSSETLESYFTNREQLQAEFQALVKEPVLSKRIFILHGIGGVGKSSMLRMFRLYCRRMGIPVALSSGDESKSLVDILSGWTRDLSTQQIVLHHFSRNLEEYHRIQNKVEEKAKLEQEVGGDTRKTAIKMAVQTVGSLAGIIPIVGIPISIALSGASDALVNWLHRFLTKQEIELLLDPAEELTNGFLNDLALATGLDQKSGAELRIVLLLDAVEQIAGLDRWLAGFARQLDPNVLLVVAGRVIPNWNGLWPGWMAEAKIEEITAMDEKVTRELVRRYYATLRGGTPDPAQVEAVIQFARGLPIAITTIVQMWVRYSVEDFQAVKPQVVADLVDQLTRGVPEQVRPALKAAGILRWFTKEILQEVMGGTTLSDDAYEDLRQFPFVRSRKEGLALHDSVRQYMDEYLRVQEPELHLQMHKRAAAYFEGNINTKAARGESTTDLVLEQLYHTTMANEAEGIRLFRKMAEELVRYQLINQLLILLNDVNNFPLQNENSRLWLRYYRANLRELLGRPEEAEPFYKMIADSTEAEDKLLAYALSDWAWSKRYTDLEAMEEILERIRTLYPDPENLPEPDAKLGFYLLQLGEVYRSMGKNWNDALACFERALKFYKTIQDIAWVAFTYNRLKYCYMDRGMWKEGWEAQQHGLQEIKKLPAEQQTYLRAEFLGSLSIGWVWMGRLSDTEKEVREAIKVMEKFERIQQGIYFYRDLGLVLGLQGKLEESEQWYQRGIDVGLPQDPQYDAVTDSFHGWVALLWEGAEKADQFLTSGLTKFRQQTKRIWEIPRILDWYAMAKEMKGELSSAEKAYQECLDFRSLEQWYFHAGALTGLARISLAKGDYTAFDTFLHEAEELSQQYEYNDYLTSLRLTQGHLAWDGQLASASGGFEAALHYYQQALIYALRYNRFLLDEVLSGRANETPLRPIITQCLDRGKEGQRMLHALYDWWRSASNSIGMPREGSIANVPEGILLLDAERMSRSREPGDGSTQKTLLEQLEQVFSKESV